MTDIRPQHLGFGCFSRISLVRNSCFVEKMLALEVFFSTSSELWTNEARLKRTRALGLMPAQDHVDIYTTLLDPRSRGTVVTSVIVVVRYLTTSSWADGGADSSF